MPETMKTSAAHRDGYRPVQPAPILPPEGITSSWLTKALRNREVDAVVENFEMEEVGTGQLGETRRFHLVYRDTPPPDAPSSVVGKFPSADATAAQTGKTMGFYRSELMFYRELAHRTDIRTPDVYVAEIDDDNEFVLLFEDLTPAWPGDQMHGCTVEEARKALTEAALLHAAFWNDTDLMAQDWCYVPEGAQGYYTTELVEQAWDFVKQNYDGHLAPDVRDVCERLVRNHAWWNRPRDFPKCFSHNDFRPDNMLFGGTDGRVAVVDWQTSNFLGTGMDVAYFLGAIFDRETRRAHEHELLREYHENLIRHGVRDYSFEHLLRDYAHYSFAQIIVAITACMIVKRTERGDRLFMHMITGAAHQALDNDALDPFPD